MTNKRECVRITIEREKERNKMFEEMMNNVIKKYGFEANETITFCTMCELVEKGLMEEKGKFSLVKMYEILMEN